MVIRRVGRPGLLGTMARTAVVAGTATAVSGGMQRRAAAGQQQAAMAEQQAAALQQAQIDAAANRAVAEQAAAAPAGDDTISKLKELAALKDSGVLSEEEFTAAKAKLLGV